MTDLTAEEMRAACANEAAKWVAPGSGADHIRNCIMKLPTTASGRAPSPMREALGRIASLQGWSTWTGTPEAYISALAAVAASALDGSSEEEV